MCQRLMGQPPQHFQPKAVSSVTPSPSFGPGTTTFMDTFRMSTVQQSSCEPSLDVSPSPGTGERSRNSPSVVPSRLPSSPMPQQFDRTLPHALHNNYTSQLHQNPNLLPSCVTNPNLMPSVANSLNNLNNPPALLLPPYLQTLYNQPKPNEIQQCPFILQ
jgi:hypothetical protein